jgi:hypothetical protein
MGMEIIEAPIHEKSDQTSVKETPDEISTEQGQDAELIIQTNDEESINEITLTEPQKAEETLEESDVGIEMHGFQKETEFVTQDSDETVERSIQLEKSIAPQSEYLEKSEEGNLKLDDKESHFSTFPPYDQDQTIESKHCNFELEDDQIVENTIKTINPKLLNLLLDDTPAEEAETNHVDHSDFVNANSGEIMEELAGDSASSSDNDISLKECHVEEEIEIDEISSKVLLEDRLEEVPEVIEKDNNQPIKQISDVTLWSSSNDLDVTENALLGDDKFEGDIEEAWETDDEDIKPEKKHKHKRRSFTYVSRKYPKKKSAHKEFDQTENRISISLSSAITAKLQHEDVRESQNVLIANESKEIPPSPAETHGLVFYPIDDPSETKHLGRTFSRVSQRAASATSNKTAPEETKIKVYLIL